MTFIEPATLNEDLYINIDNNNNNNNPANDNCPNNNDSIKDQQPIITANIPPLKGKKPSSYEPDLNTKESTVSQVRLNGNNTEKGSLIINVKNIRFLCWNPKCNDEFTIESHLNSLHCCKNNTLNNENNSNFNFESNLNRDSTEERPFNLTEYGVPIISIEKIIKLIETYFVSDIPQNILTSVTNELLYLSAPKDKIIFDDNDDGNFFYIVSKGNLLLTDKKCNKELKEWDCFGELSLLESKKRNGKVTCLDNVELFVIDSEYFRGLQKKSNEEILKERYNFLNTIFIFECLDKISKYNVAQKLTQKEFEPNEKIIKKDEIGNTLYIIKEGIVSCRINDQEIRQLKSGDYFGENAILVEVKRGADIIAVNKCICYELSKEDLKDALSEDYIDVILFCFFKNCVENNEYLKNVLTESIIHEIFICFNVKLYSKNEQLYNPKNNHDNLKANNKKLVIVIGGSLYKNKDLIAERGKIIGEELFKDYNKQIITEDIIAVPDCITLEASICDLAKIMKIDLNKEEEKQLKVMKYINKLKKLYLFKNLSEKTLESIALNMKKQKFKNNEVIVEENTYGDKFFLISKGKVKITKEGKSLRELEAGSCLGENALLTDNVLRTASAIAVGKVLCYIISKSDFNLILTDDTMKEFLLKKLALQDTSISLSDLNYIKFLGKGKFGSVSLVHNGKNIYAIKAISRKSVDREKILAKYFVNERRIMLSLDHPFIVKMVKSMKNKHFCFLLMEYVNGKNMDEFLSSKATKKNIEETKFYIGSLLLMVDYLQKKFIVHRDIKPSNIMLDSNGYLKMIDFGTAKILTDYTSTIIGTPHYIAPEILQGKGYSMSCDFWSVGICMYEIFYGIYPFGNYANEVIEIYKDILNKDFSFPSDNAKYAHVNSFIRDLLNKKVNQRICNFSILKKKPFFENFDFDKLNDFKLKPPTKPKAADFSQYLKEKRPYEQMVQEDNSSGGNKKVRDNGYPPGYNPNWADEF